MHVLPRAAAWVSFAALIWAGTSGPVHASIDFAGHGDPHSWTVYHHDRAGTGVADHVTAVDTATRAWASAKLDGQIYGEPLIFQHRVYVATENDTVYALSAGSGAVVWSRHLGDAVPAGSLPCGNISPTVGITGTPVIDASRHELFVVADELRNGKPAHILFGLSTASGRQRLSQSVDPPGADTAAILQRTALTLDKGRVLFGYGGNYGDCASYRGRLVAVPEGGGTPRFFTVDSAPGESQGAVWMGGGAPAIDARGRIWISTGNGSVSASSHAYDHSDGLLELSPSLHLLQFFAPRSWASDNANDVDMSTEPVLLPGGQVVVTGKSRIVYLVNGAHLGGIGGQQAKIGPVCADDIDGGSAVRGMTVYLPCLSGIVAVKAGNSPPGLQLLWHSGVGGGPPIIAAGLVWTMGQNGELYGLDPVTGKIRRQAKIGIPANHFPSPSVGDGIFVAACATNVVAFPAATQGLRTTAGRASVPAGQAICQYSQPGPPIRTRTIAAIAFACLLVLAAVGLLIWRRRAALNPARQ